MKKVKVLKYDIGKPHKKGDKVYSNTYDLYECTNVIDLRCFGYSRCLKPIKSYKSEKALMNYISKNKIDLNEYITFNV